MKEENLQEKSPPGWSGTVKAMKKHKELTSGKTKKGEKKNVFALAWYMHNKGAKPHYKPEKEKKVGKKTKFSEWLEIRESKDKWMADAVKKPGSLNKAASKAGESKSEYCADHKAGKAEKKCNLWHTFNKFRNKK